MDAHDISQVRRFNRFVTQRAGALETSYLARGRPLAEARVIFEIDPVTGAALSEVRGRLGLDTGYFSRLLRSLERQGLVRVEAGDGDARRRRVALTGTGRDERAAYDTLSDHLAADMLAGLAPVRRARLISAMAEVERLLRASSIRINHEPADSADARACLDAYFAELDRRFDGGFDPAAGPRAKAQGGREWFVIARLDGAPVGCGAVKQIGPDAGEIKRLWVAPAARGLGLARRLMERLEALAREAGFSVIRLDTNRALSEAQALYRGLGYREIARYNDNPYAHYWFEKVLDAPSQAVMDAAGSGSPA